MNQQEINLFITVEQNHRFSFPGLCPYCYSKLTYHAEEWEQNEDGTWQATLLYSDCDSEPDMGSKEWKCWFKQHSYMPHLFQLPLDNKVQEEINAKYRFRIT